MMQTITSHRHNNKSFMDHQYHLYTKAIDSIKKYPLPIICEEQLGMLAGIGGTLAGKLVHVIRLYYRKFMKGVEGGVDEGIWNG
jgi:hypothetical protein